MLEPKQVKTLIATALVLSCAGGLGYTGTRSPSLDVLVYDDPAAERVVKFLSDWAKGRKMRLQVTRLPYDELYSTVRDRGAEFDLLLLDDPWVAGLAEKGDVLSPITDRELRLRMPQYAPEFSEVCYYQRGRPSPGLKVSRRPVNGEVGECAGQLDSKACVDLYQRWDLYAMPVVGNVQLLLLADDVLPPGHKRTNPLSWRQLYDAIVTHGKLPEHSGPGKRPVRFVFRGGSSNAALADFLPILHASDARLITADEVAVPDKANTMKAFRFSLDLARLSPVQHARLNDQDVYQHLVSDEAEAGICWLAYVSGIKAERKRRNGDAERDKALIELPMPRPQATSDGHAAPRDGLGAGVTGAWVIAVGQKARNARGAWEFMKDVTGRKVAEQMKEEGNPAAYEDLLGENRVIVRAARPRPAHPRWKEIEDAAGLRIQQVYWHAVTPEEALKRAAFDICEILEAEKGANEDKRKLQCAIEAEPNPGKRGPP